MKAKCYELWHKECAVYCRGKEKEKGSLSVLTVEETMKFANVLRRPIAVASKDLLFSAFRNIILKKFL
jgi:hypothetical protein